MTITVTDDYIKLSSNTIEWLMLSFTDAGITVLPYGYANTFNEIEVNVEDGYIHDSRVVELFKLRQLNNKEIQLIGPILRNATFYYMLICQRVDTEAEYTLLEQFPSGAFYRSNSTRC